MTKALISVKINPYLKLMDSQISAKEKEILKFWRDNKIFEKSLRKRNPKGDYVFYDGPPFATGTPHYGHIPSSIMKDAVPRFWTANGYHVARRWGWDCHGLPVENLIEKELNINSKRQIEEEIGVCGFNDACKKSVMRYAEVWKEFIPRLGRWVDMEDDYKTMNPTFMESIWWVFKTLFDKGLIYQGYKAMHICPRCDTTLSNFEVTQNYKDVKDLSVVAKFRVTKARKHESTKAIELPENTYILAWTTTPWTLPGNVALAVGKNIDYILMEIIESKNEKFKNGEKYVFSKEYFSKMIPHPEGYEELSQLDSNKIYFLNAYNETKVKIRYIKGDDLVGHKYKPLFDYFVNADLNNKKNIYTVQTADFVSVADGTGVVHIAPGFGEDDMNLGKEKNLPTIIHVTPEGRFTAEVKDWPGELVKSKDDPRATDKKVAENLEKRGLVFRSEEFSHSYPFCWRCDTPLLNYATTSWFVKVTAIKENLIKNNLKVHWTPAHLKEGRFGKWLENASDWSISRQRYWGTPIPVWQCQDGLELRAKSLEPKANKGCGNIKTIGSITELEKLSGKKVDDLHKQIVDEITFKCEKCGGLMKRIPDVLDCWFESGSMPYAQVHYPFENKDWFEKHFPAEFIAEGVDQTRGWFYTLMVLSTALFNKPAFKNVVVNGIVLTEGGQKMAKRLKNYPEPDLVIANYGADALRYYMLTSPVCEAESLNFSEAGVKEALQKVVMLLGNVLSFYQMYQKQDISPVLKVENILDKWILAKLNLLIKEVTENMKNYDIVKASRPFAGFINELSTWYLRRSRKRFKEGDQAGINTLGLVLSQLAKTMAPFMPFLAEDIYRQIGGPLESVHLENWPEFEKELIDEKLLVQMAEARKIVEQGLAARAEAGIKIRQPLASLRVSDQPAFALSGLRRGERSAIGDHKELLGLIKDELNVKDVIFGKQPENEVMLDTALTPELKFEGQAREIIRQINQSRKEAGLTIGDKVVIYHIGLNELFGKFGEEIKNGTLAEKVEAGEAGEMKEIEGGKVGIKKVGD